MPNANFLQKCQFYNVFLKVSSPFTVIYRAVQGDGIQVTSQWCIEYRHDPTDKSVWGTMSDCTNSCHLGSCCWGPGESLNTNTGNPVGLRPVGHTWRMCIDVCWEELLQSQGQLLNVGSWIQDVWTLILGSVHYIFRLVGVLVAFSVVVISF